MANTIGRLKFTLAVLWPGKGVGQSPAAVLAERGTEDQSAAQSAFAEGWAAALDRALPKLDQLKSAEKEKLVRALITIVLQTAV